MTRTVNVFGFIICLGICVLAGFSTAAGIDFTHEGDVLWGHMEDAVIDGKHVFCAMNHGLMILDITDPGAPTLVSSYGILNGEGDCIAVSGNYAFLGIRSNGMLIFDISDVSSPQLVSHLPVVNWVSSVDVAGSTAFVCDAFQGLRVIDISDPANPAEVAFVPEVAGHGYEVSIVRGNYLYISSWHRFWVLDISDPTDPQELGSYVAPDQVWDFSLADSLAYLACSDSGMIILNIADPAAPGEISRLSADSVTVRSLAKLGNTVYWGQGNWQYGYKLVLIDVSDPSLPTISGEVPTGGYLLRTGTEIMLVTDVYDSYEIYDITDPNAPQGLSANPIPYYGFPGYGQEIVTDGRYIYVAGGNMGLVIVDNGDPNNPTVVSKGINANRCFDLDLREGYVYLVDNGDYNTEGLKVVDVSRPSEPVIVGSCRLNSCNKIVLSGSYAFIGGNSSQNYIFNISDPTDPVQLGSFQITGITNDFARNGHYLYSSYDFGIVVTDIADPANPVIMDTMSADPGCGELLMYKGYLLVGISGGFQVMDVATDPLSPTPVAFCVCSAEDIKAYGDYLFTGDYRGVNIIDMQTPTSPVVVGSQPLEYGAHSVAPYFNGVATYDPDGLTTFQVVMPACCTHPGDANYDQTTNMADVVYLINLIFKDGPPLLCPAAGDANGDCNLNIGDAVCLVNYIFKSGDAPVCGDCP